MTKKQLNNMPEYERERERERERVGSAPKLFESPKIFIKTLFLNGAFLFLISRMFKKKRKQFLILIIVIFALGVGTVLELGKLPRMVFDNGNNITLAQTSPTIASGTLAADNSYVNIAMSEAVYNTSGGSGALEGADFALTFTQNSGNATDAGISTVTKTDGNPLVGGEETIRANLSITGTPSGVETVEIKAAATSIYNAVGIAMTDTETTGAKTLNDQLAPTMDSAQTKTATTIDVTFSEDLDGDTVAAADFEVSVVDSWYEAYGPDGTNEVVQIGSMYVACNTNTDGTANGGTKQWQAAMDWADGLNWLGQTDWRMPTGSTGGELSTIYTNKDSLGTDTTTHYWTSTESSETYAYTVSFYSGSVLTSYKLNSNSVRAVRNVTTLAVSTATESSAGVVTLTVAAMPTGATPTVAIAAAGSVSDIVGNACTSGSVAASDGIIIPVLSSAARDTDTQITVTLSELGLEATIDKDNDGGFTVAETGAPATTYAISAINPLVAGNDDEVVLTVADMGVSAKEGVTITYTAGVNGTVTDVPGNALATDATGVTISAWDTTVPTAAITYSESGPYKTDDAITITATFNEDMADSPAPKIAISGSNTLEATDMTWVSTTEYTYDHTVGAGNGTATVALSVGTDIAGNVITSVPTGGATFTVDNVAPTITPVLVDTDGYVNAAETSSGIDILITTTGVEDGQTVTCNVKDAGDAHTVGPVTGDITSNAVTIVSTALTSLNDGTITVTCDVSDAVGNPAPQGSDTSVKDAVASTVAITAPLTGSNVKGTTVITFTDDELTNAQCSIDNSVWNSCVSNTTALSDITGFDGLSNGAFTLYLKDTDTAGNIGTDTETGIIKDSSTPDISAINAGPSSGDRILLASDTWFKYSNTGSDDQISFSWTDSSSPSDDTFYYELNSISTNTITGDESNTTNPYIDDIAITEGTNYFHVKPKNGANTWGTERLFIVKYDKTVPSNISVSSITADSSSQLTIISSAAADSNSGLHSTPYWFNETTDGSGATDSTVWQNSTSFIDDGLSPNTQYTYQVKAKDAVENESSYSSVSSKYTLANIPSSLSLAADSSSQITASWNANSNPANTEYYIENTTAGTNSGWITSTSWTSSNLTCGTSYSFKVKARNGDNVETDYTDSASVETDGCGGGFISPTPPIISLPQNQTFEIAIIEDQSTINLSNVENAYQMAISTTPDFEYVSWEPYQENIDLPDTDKVYLKFRSKSGGVSEVYEIEVDSETTDTPVIPNGSLVRAINDYKVYIINNSYLRHIIDEIIFSFYKHLNKDNIQEISSSLINDYQESYLIRASNDYKVYKIIDNEKRWLDITVEEFENLGYNWDEVYVVNGEEWGWYEIEN